MDCQSTGALTAVGKNLRWSRNGRFYLPRGLCSLRAIIASGDAISTKPLEINRKRRIHQMERRYYDSHKSSHVAQKNAVQLAKYRRFFPERV
jgi:hypothetical protein